MVDWDRADRLIIPWTHSTALVFINTSLLRKQRRIHLKPDQYLVFKCISESCAFILKATLFLSVRHMTQGRKTPGKENDDLRTGEPRPCGSRWVWVCLWTSCSSVWPGEAVGGQRAAGFGSGLVLVEPQETGSSDHLLSSSENSVLLYKPCVCPCLTFSDDQCEHHVQRVQNVCEVVVSKHPIITEELRCYREITSPSFLDSLLSVKIQLKT